jgi:4a-hydroxytetrahydrobiopterin dehydratase
MALLEKQEIDSALAGDLNEWSQEGDAIVRSVEAPSFLEGIELVRRVADAAEASDHHPDIDIRWRTVTFRLSTHSEGGITDNDIVMAGTIDKLV